jgi:hypothetical protein
VYHTPHQFMGPMECDHVSDLYFLDIPRPSLGNTVNMVGIREHHEGSVHTLLGMATPTLDLHALSIPRLNTSKMMDMVWIHYRTLRVSL